MKIDYNQLFFRDKNYVEFVVCDTKVRYKAYVAGIITQRFGGISYELGVTGADKRKIYESLTLKEAPAGMKTSDGHQVSKLSECEVNIIIPITKYYDVEVPGFVSNFHIDDGLCMEEGWFDCLYDYDIITEDEWEEIEALQISVQWEDYGKIVYQKMSGIFPKKDIFPDIEK